MIARQACVAWRPSAVTASTVATSTRLPLATSSSFTLDDYAAARQGNARPMSTQEVRTTFTEINLHPRASGKAARAVEQRQLQREIADLRAKIVEADKVQSAKEVASKYGAVSEDLLDKLFEAVSTPDPPTPEQLRSEQRKQRRAQLKLQHQQQELTRRLEQLHGKLQSISADVDRRSMKSEIMSQDSPRFLNATEQLTAAIKHITLNDSRNVVEDTLEAPTFDKSAQKVAIHLSDAGAKALDHLDRIRENLQLVANDKSSLSFPFPFAGSQDWKDIARSFAMTSSLGHCSQLIERQLVLMAAIGHSDNQTSALNCALEELARRGDVLQVEQTIEVAQRLGIELTQYASHCLVKAFTVAGRLDEAEAVIVHLEETRPAAMMTYSLLIRALLSRKGDMAQQSRVWTIFARMRLKAHAIPDALLFAQMIQACGLGIPQPNSHLWTPRSQLLAADDSSSQRAQLKAAYSGKALPDTERALDLFKEMTETYGLKPTGEVYDALIFACARRRDTYDKALEFLHNVIEMERRSVSLTDGSSGFQVGILSATTFNAILAGCARNGDLFRARWILAEMLRTSLALARQYELRASLGQTESLEPEMEAVRIKRPNAETLALIFYAYANYKVPSAKALKASPSTPKPLQTENTEDVVEDRMVLSNVEEVSGEDKEFSLSRQMPMTHRAVIREVDGLMARLIEDKKNVSGDNLFSLISPHGKMINGYLAAIAAHEQGSNRLLKIKEAVLERQGQDHEGKASLLEQLDVPLSAHMCMTVLEIAQKEGNRTLADELVDNMWRSWQSLEAEWRRDALMQKKNSNITAATVSRAWAAMINNLAKSHHLERGMDTVRDFVSLYPPTRASPQEDEGIFDGVIPESRPVLTHQALSLLHHRLKEAQYSAATQEDIDRLGRCIGELTWIAHAYESLLRPSVPGAFRRFPKTPPPRARREDGPRLLSVSHLSRAGNSAKPRRATRKS